MPTLDELRFAHLAAMSLLEETEQCSHKFEQSESWDEMYGSAVGLLSTDTEEDEAVVACFRRGDRNVASWRVPSRRGLENVVGASWHELALKIAAHWDIEFEESNEVLEGMRPEVLAACIEDWKRLDWQTLYAILQKEFAFASGDPQVSRSASPELGGEEVSASPLRAPLELTPEEKAKFASLGLNEVEEDVLAWLREHQGSVDSVRDGVGKNRQAVSEALKRLSSEGLIAKSRKRGGYYRKDL